MDIVLIALTVTLLTCLWLLIRRPPHPVDQLPGPPTIPFFGNALNFAKPPTEGFKNAIDICNEYRPIFRLWLTKYIPVVNPIDPKYVETVLHNSVHIEKSFEMKSVEPWLGKGLLSSQGSKWHPRRKLLTPAFHFSILEQFLPVFCDKSRIFIEKLRDAANSKLGGFDIVPMLSKCTLDVICETAMGYPINAQEEQNSEYISSISEICDLVYYRNRRPWLYPDWIFKLSSAGRQQEKCVKILHDFTDKVIIRRREELKKSKNENITLANTEDKNFGRKMKTAFLDLLLRVSEQDPSLTDQEIRSEVDTFMFAGHDTTAMGMSWAFHLLSVHPDIQKRCVEELEEIFSGSDRDPNMNDLANMKYLERVIKETLRIRTPVRLIARKLHKSIKFEGYEEFPAGTVVHIHVYGIHHNPDIYPDPEKFDPDRFLPENCVGRHPYAYIPFSAGPRNCIGQRYAMLEMKTVMSTVLRNFRLESCDPKMNGVVVPAILLKPLNGVRLRLYPR